VIFGSFGGGSNCDPRKGLFGDCALARANKKQQAGPPHG
jgi:hypothetical protein